MLASELVKKLEQVIRDHGDKEVVYLDYGYGDSWAASLDKVYLDKVEIGEGEVDTVVLMSD